MTLKGTILDIGYLKKNTRYPIFLKFVRYEHETDADPDIITALVKGPVGARFVLKV